MQLQKMLDVPMRWAAAEGARHEIVLASRIRLARNLIGEVFPARATDKARRGVLEKVFGAARRTTQLSQAAVIELADVDHTDRIFLVERHLVSPNLAAHPRGRGVAIGDRESLSLMVNEEDHVRLAGFGPGLCLAEICEWVRAVEYALAASTPFAFRKDWGYLTACPTNLGTAMRVSALVHLPGLVLAGFMDKLLENLTRLGLLVRGLYGEGTKVLGDFYQISNATALGRTEGELVAAVTKAVGQVADRESECRQRLLAGPSKLRVEDMVYRSAAALQGARVMSFEEASQHLSRYRMGLALGWKLPGSLAAANELLLITQPAHIQMHARKELSPQERDAQRAGLIRSRLTV